MKSVRFNALNYSLKVWLSTVAAAPLIYYLISILLHVDDEFTGYSPIAYLTEPYLMLVIFGAIFSFITWVAFYVVILIIIKFAPYDLRKLKYLIALAGALLTLLTFYVVLGILLHADLIYMVLSYALCITIGSVIYSLGVEYEPETDII